jgi:transposase
MEKELLESYLEQGLTLREIGERTGKHLTTVGYWVKRHALRAANAKKFAPKRSAISKQRLEGLVGQGASLNDLAEVLGLSKSTVRHWLQKYGLETSRMGWRRQQTRRAREAGLRHITRNCAHHGMTTFILEGRGYYRCAECRKRAVSNWRRRAKLRLVEAAGGHCLLCGYDRHPGALHFHHLDPAQKRYTLSRAGHTRSFAEALEEAKKCVLLCANCHAEIEAGFATLPGAQAQAGREPLDAKVSPDSPG